MAAPATTTHTVSDGYELATVRLTALFGSSQETGVTKIDISSLLHADPVGSPTFSCALESIKWDISGDGVVTVLLNSTSVADLSHEGALYGGGLSAFVNSGDVKFTTTSMASTDTYDITVTIRKGTGYINVPVAVSADVTNESANYTTGDTIEATVVFSEPVFITGVPTLELELDTTVEALCTVAPETWTTDVTFSYTVLSSDHINVGSFDIGDITLHNSADITGGFATGRARLTDYVVDGVASVNASIGVNVTTLGVALVAGTGPRYDTGETITFTVTASAAATVTGTPRIPVVITSGNKFASYVSGSGTTSLVFSYTPVTVSDVSNAGTVSVTSPVQLNGGTIHNAQGNPVTLAFSAPNMSAVSFNHA